MDDTSVPVEESSLIRGELGVGVGLSWVPGLTTSKLNLPGLGGYASVEAALGVGRVWLRIDYESTFGGSGGFCSDDPALAIMHASCGARIPALRVMPAAQFEAWSFGPVAGASNAGLEFGVAARAEVYNLPGTGFELVAATDASAVFSGWEDVAALVQLQIIVSWNSHPKALF